MRTETTDWNNAGYASAKTFVDVQSGNAVAIGANLPQNVRAMELEVQQGEYTAQPDTVAGGTDISQSASYSQNCTVTLSAAAVPYAAVKCASANTGVVTVPALVRCNASGVASIRYTKVAAGGPVNVTLTCGTASDTVAVTFT
jgi:hypothetical protein